MATPDILRFDLRQERGEDFGPQSWTLVDDATGLPIDLTGYTCEIEIRDAQGGSILLTVAENVSASVTGLYMADAAIGKMQVLIKSASVSGFAGSVQAARPLAWGLVLTDNTGAKRVYARGVYNLEPTSAT